MSDADREARLHLARLCREIMTGAQFNSRTGYAALRINHGDDSYKDVAIDNWMAASPIYTRRMQRALGFAGGRDVETIFKGLQLDCGFSHQYFDVHYSLDSATAGRFWLNSCGALLEAEPRGDEAVRVMCHDIEDPTFDATAVATNPRARMRPLHRPPRTPEDRQPHCEWRVFIDEEAEALPEPEAVSMLADSRLAQLKLPSHAAEGGGGLADYSGPLHEQMFLEYFSEAALETICAELSIQYHLLINGLYRVIAARFGEDAAVAVSEFQMIGSAWVVSERLAAILPDSLQGIERLARVLETHPAFNPVAYFNARVTRADDDRLLFEFGDSEARRESAPAGWFHLLELGITSGLESLVRGVDARAVVMSAGEGNMAWEVVLDESAPEAEEPLPVQIAKGAVLYQTKLQDNIPALQL